MTWDDENPFPPLWGYATIVHKHAGRSLDWTAEDRAAGWWKRRGDQRIRRNVCMIWRDDELDFIIMRALTQQAQRGVKPVARPFAWWLEATKDLTPTK